MKRSRPASDDSMARTWRARQRKQRLVNLATSSFVIGVFWLADWASAEGLFSLAHWPMLMPVALVLLFMFITGNNRYGGRDYRVAGLVAGDRSAIQAYPEVVQRALVRAVAAGAEEATLLPVSHRVLWRLRVAVPPVAFAPFRTDFLLLFGTLFVLLPLWLFVQDWWTPGGSDTARQAGMVATGMVAAIAALVAAQRAGTRERLGLPTWREFRDRSPEEQESG